MALMQIDYGTPLYKKMVQLRYEILRKPLGLIFTDDELQKEKDDIMIAAFDDDQILGCCLLTRMDAKSCRLRQMAVRNDLQGKGIGQAILHFAENLARDHGYKYLKMHARKTALGFYEKQGYKTVGTEFTEVTVPHYLMEKRLD